ncbi:hypothetical protein EZV73_01275 [Acidaminobacter sp. JC074]|uniref:methyl-accepting chemotaxis protein n=1 Tax=Acidaminobacter sp. JC074 TaxID=2530199 RepID=UPI001F0FDAE3|nr:methyl-accepting chemotaxis protein [Acidaminobacter sp. JC074]MCH4886174.1 hypothetical protein [Acidaminobacter sp. JC074]
MFKKNYHKKFVEFMPYLKEVMQKDIMVSVTDLEKFISYVPGDALDVKVKVGSKIPEGDPLQATIKNNQIITAVVPKEVYGLPFRAVTYPIRDDNGKCVGAVGIAESLAKEEKIAGSLGNVVTEIEESNAAIRAITGDITDMTSGIQELAATSEEVASSVDSITTLSTNIYAMVEEASAASQSVMTEAKEGIESVSEINTMIGDVSSEIIGIKDQIETLYTSISKAYEMIELINNISSQTNLLALNASIEAARAGEHGKGFAVVADEVGKLAVQSQDSATEISEIMKSIQNDISSVVNRVNKTAENTDKNKGQVETATKNIESILREINDVDAAVGSVKDQIEKQVHSTTEMQTAIESLADTVDQSANYGSRISDNLQEQMNQLEHFEAEVKTSVEDILK